MSGLLRVAVHFGLGGDVRHLLEAIDSLLVQPYYDTLPTDYTITRAECPNDRHLTTVGAVQGDCETV